MEDQTYDPEVSTYFHDKYRGQKTKSEYPLARAFAMMWLNMNGFEIRVDSNAKKIASKLGLVPEGKKVGYAKKAIVAWHLTAIQESRTKPKEVIAKDFYSSQSWRAARFQALKKSGGRCVLCGSPPGKYSLHVDHIKPRSLYPSRALDPDNLQCLCRDCNLGRSNKDATDWRRPRPKILPTE